MTAETSSTLYPIVGILGVGKLGSVLGQLAVQAGYPVLMANDKPASAIKLIVETIVPGARAVESSDLFAKSSLVILAIPLSKFQSIPATWAQHTIIVDAMNYWWEKDGLDNVYSTREYSSSERVQLHFKKSNVVKALNHMGYHDLQAETRKPSDSGRKAIAVAGDNREANKVVTDLVDRLGFDPLDIGPLKNGRILEPGSPLFGADLPRNKLQELVEKQLHTQG